MAIDKIRVRGAREHNLKNIDVDIPRDKLVVVTGLSGSGKSTLAFDTIYAEGQRRYVESLSAYARQFLEQMSKPDVDVIEGLSPAISIEQKTSSRNPRSTVGTVTEIYDYLRLLYARVGIPHCYQCGKPIKSQTTTQMVDALLELPEGTKIHLLSPVIRSRKGEYRKEFAEWAKQGFVRVKVNGEVRELSEDIPLDKQKKHDIDLFVDRLVIKKEARVRMTDSIETVVKLSGGLLRVEILGEGNKVKESRMMSENFACVEDGISYPELEPRMFSFNNPHGACPDCDGIGSHTEFSVDLVIDRDEPLKKAIRPWVKEEETDFDRVAEALADHFEFDLTTPWKKLPVKVQTAILEGLEEPISVKGKRISSYKHKFEGVLPLLKRQYENAWEWQRQLMEEYMNAEPCESCGGSRLRKEARFVRVGGKPINEVTALSLRKTRELFETLELPPRDAEIARRILKEIRDRLGFLTDIGLEYLTLDRGTATLSGGEGQRIRLATQISSSLVGVLYILDEPSIGLHQRDNKKLLETLKRLRDLGNTVLVVEHDEETILEADWVLDLGPGAGANGGKLVFSGLAKDLVKAPGSITADYLSGKKKVPIPEQRRKAKDGKFITIQGARAHNLQGVTAKFPLGTFIAVTGVSGSGKSTLILDTLHKAVARQLYRAKEPAGAHDKITGLEAIDKVIDIDQSPIGRTPRSNPATYTGIFTVIRDLFAQLPESKARGYAPGRFSFNVKGGRCEACSGDGVVKIEMHFLPDIFVKCDQCDGKRYNRQTLEVRYKGKNISEVLEMTVAEGREFFEPVPALREKLVLLDEVGLSYIHLGQQATTLSGGEAQRIKLAKELAKRETSRTLYILDEPTTGLHFADVHKLIEVLDRLVKGGNTVVVIEHNLDVIKFADWIIDLGPDGGDRGGEIVAEGTPEDVAKVARSYTGQFLKKILEKAKTGDNGSKQAGSAAAARRASR